MRLEGKIAVVTGGAKGIGAGIARRFAAEGASVVIADIDERAGNATLEEITSSGGTADFITTDVSEGRQVKVLFDTTLARFKHVDVLVNNAGIAHGPQMTRHFLELPQEMWERLIAVHLDGLFYCSQRAARIMVKQGTGGSIINMSSGGAILAHRCTMAYDMTKGGIDAATRAMALDLAPWHIRVNGLRPGAIQVESRIGIGDETSIDPSDVVPWGRFGTPEDLMGPAVFLASDEAAYVTGHILTVDGGLMVQLRSPAIDAKIERDIENRI